MPRIKCKVLYDGTRFAGFQVQNKERTVQGELQKAISKIAQEEITIHASGRTDAKVHAKGQIFHFDTEKTIPADSWKRGVNTYLPNDIYISTVEEVDESFHARYSATGKEYRYYLSTLEYDPMQTNYIYQYNRELDVEAMQDAANIFLGEHDFAAYCTYDKYGNTVRTIHEFAVTNNEGIIEFKVRGNGFRRYMVRHLVGALIQIGAHRYTKQQALEKLESNGQDHILFKAKPQGLYLWEVFYDGTKKPHTIKSLLESTSNTRIIGNFVCNDGKRLIPNRILRSDVPNSLSDKDIDFIRRFNLLTVIDLRGQKEVENKPSAFSQINGIHYYSIPIESGSVVPESVDEVSHSYLSIAHDPNIVNVFKTIASTDEGVIIHCTAGKDRTGVVTAILLKLCSVNDADIIENYVITKIYNKEILEALEESYPDLNMEIVVPQERYMREFLDLLMNQYGNIQNYLLSIGLTKQEINQLIYKMKKEK